MSRNRLTVATRDAWLLAAEALAAGREQEARSLADRAMQLSDWNRYKLVYGEADTGIHSLELLPPEWAYHAVDGWRQVLLVHPSAGPFFVLAHDFTAMARAARAMGPGLLRLEEVLVAGVLGELQPIIPDGPQGLF